MDFIPAVYKVIKSIIADELAACLDVWTVSAHKNQPIDIVYQNFSRVFDRVSCNSLVYELGHFSNRGNQLTLHACYQQYI